MCLMLALAVVSSMGANDSEQRPVILVGEDLVGLEQYADSQGERNETR